MLGRQPKPKPKRLWIMGIAATKDGQQKIWIQMDRFDAAANADLKACMPGPYSWHSKSGRWIFPLNWEACMGARKVADKSGADLDITKELYEWAMREREHQETIPDVQSMELVDLPIVRTQFPAIWNAISSRPFQSVGAAFAGRNRSCLIADQPGLGKTIQSLAAVVEAGTTGPILIVAPKQACKLTWPAEIRKWLGPQEITVWINAGMKPAERKKSLEMLKELENSPQRIWIITSPNYLRLRAETDDYGKYVRDANGQKIVNPVGEGLLELQRITWSAIIVDESHQTLPVPSGNVKKQSAQRVGLGALEVKTNGLRLALSGTPFRGKEVYLWGQLNWLRPDLYRAYWRWVEKYFDVTRDRYGMQIGRMIDAEGMYNEAKNVMIRRTKAEVAKDLPPKMYAGWPLDPGVPGSPVAVWLDMLPEQAKQYNEMVKEAAVKLDGGLLMANSLLAEMTRLKQFAGSCGKIDADTGRYKPTAPSNKLDYIIEWLDERGIDGKTPITADTPKVVIASQFTGILDVIADGLKTLGIHGHKFDGRTKDEDREKIKNDWQDNPNSTARVLLLSIKAGGVSLTLDAADDLIMVDETHDPAETEQVEDRLHRLSRMHNVTIWNLRSRGTIEEHIMVANQQAEFNIKDIMDGSRGVGFSKVLLGV